MKKDIWVLMEPGQADGYRESSLALLHPCRALADTLGGTLTAVALFGGDVAKGAAIAGAYGADRLLLADREALDPAAALASLAEKEHPWAILAVSACETREYLPRACARMGTGFAVDCSGFALDAKADCLVWTRPAFGGSVLCDVVCPVRRPQIGTVRSGIYQQRSIPRALPAAVSRFTPAQGDSPRVRVFRLLRNLAEDGIDLENADIIVAGGKGVGGPQGFRPLRELAAALGGAVGASRSAVDRGWISGGHQIGQTGHTVAPKLYIACGISGAIQHLTGMLGSGTIVAVNVDPNAAIFQYSDYSVVGDLFEVLPALTREILRH